MTENTKSTSSMAKGLLVGGIVGAAAALLLAPKPGRELRADLTNRYLDMQDKTKRTVAAVRDKALTMVRHAEDQASEVLDDARKNVN